MGEESSGSKLIYVLIGFFFIAVISAVSAWFYFTQKSTQQVSNNLTADSPSAHTETSITDVSSAISDQLEEIEEELTSITTDMGSEDDDTANL